jgi:hypothetical protein
MTGWGSGENMPSTFGGEGMALQETEPGPDVEEDVHNLDEQKPVYVGLSHGCSGFKRMYKFDGSRRVVVPPALDLLTLTDDEAECLRLAGVGRYDGEMIGGLLIGHSISDGGGTMIPLTPAYGPDNTVDFSLPSHILHGSSLRVSNLVHLGLASSNHGVGSVLGE